jgi:hypothetical protein
MANDSIFIEDLSSNVSEVRVLTDEEQAELDANREITSAERQARIDAQNKKEQDRLAILVKLGLTEDEAKAIIG